MTERPSPIRHLACTCLLVGLAACTPDSVQVPEDVWTTDALARLHPYDAERAELSAWNAPTCARLYGHTADRMGHDRAETRRVLTRFFHGKEAVTIRDPAARKPYFEARLDEVGAFVDATSEATTYSIVLPHDERMAYGRLIGAYDTGRSGFPAEQGQFRQDHKAFFGPWGGMGAICTITFAYAKPWRGYARDFRYIVTDRSRVIEIEHHRATDDLQMRFMFEPVAVEPGRAELTARIVAIRFESRDGEVLGEVEHMFDDV